MVWTEALTLIGVPIVRGFAGWIENAAKDGKFEDFEWKELGSTVIRIGIIGSAAYFGLGGLGIDISAIGASGAAVIMDFLLSAIKKIKKK